MTKVLKGIGTLSLLPEIRSRFQAKRVLLVTGKASYSTSGAQDIANAALQNDDVVQFSDFEVNPKIEDAERGVALARAAGVDLIIGIGGGSVMDMAKLIKAFYSSPDKSVELARGTLVMTDPGIPMILVPTTAGSGSEATHFAVVYIGLDKYSLASKLLLPDAVILDGSLIASASSYQLACNGLDALAQAIESAWAAGSTDQSRDYSFQAVSRCKKYIKEVMKPNATNDALQAMIEASNMAGKAINISKTTAPHAWSYAFTSNFGVPHGHAVWLTLPSIFEMHATASHTEVTDPRGPTHLNMVMRKLMDILDINCPENSAKHLKSYLNELSVEAEMTELGVDTNAKRKFLSNQVNTQRMSNNPIRFSRMQIKKIFEL